MTTQSQTLKLTTSLRRQVFSLAFPAVGEQFLNLLVGLADTYLVGHMTLAVTSQLGYGLAEGLAAVGLANNVIWLITTLFMAGAVGATALIARAIGARDTSEANGVVRQSVLLGVSMGIIGLAAMYWGAPLTMRMFGAEPAVAQLGVGFLHITAISMPLAGLMFMLNAAMRGAGDTKTPLLIMLLVNGLNILISWLLINGRFGLPALGVAGAAWGASIGRSVGGIVVLIVLLNARGVLKLDRLPRPDWDMLRRILKIGVPTGLEQFVFQGALIIFTVFVTGLGATAYAAHNTVLNAESISFLPGLGFAVAATTLVGQGLGAGDVQRARQSGHEAFFQAGIFMGIMGLLFVLVPEWFLSILVDNDDIVRAGALPLRFVGIIQPLLAANFVYAGALRGAGDTLWPLLIKLISPWLVRLPLAFFLVPLYGLTGAWIAMSTDLALQGVLAWWRFRGRGWERIRV